MPASSARKTTLKVGDRLTDGLAGRVYRICGLIGRGGMGEVYLAEVDGAGELVAVKTIPLALVEDEKTRARTHLEMTALSRLRHRNVVPVYASGVRDGVIFMVMQLLVGATLQELNQRNGRIPIAWSLEILRDVCLGLHAVHALAVHRDIKPANIHFGADAVTRVIDLGAAKWRASGKRLTSTGTQLGTLAYMAPEGLDESSPIDAQTDIWAVGVVLYELLSNRYPFDFDGKLPASGYKLGSRIIDDPHVPLGQVAPLVPEFIRFIVDRALEKDPGKRFRSAEEMAMVLDAALGRFVFEKGPSPPLSELADSLFPEGVQRLPSGLVIPVTPERRYGRTTVPMSAPAPPAQPTALPYLPTEEVATGAKAAAADTPSAMDPPTRPEHEAPRTSDVFPTVRGEPAAEDALPAAEADADAPASVDRGTLLPSLTQDSELRLAATAPPEPVLLARPAPAAAQSDHPFGSRIELAATEAAARSATPPAPMVGPPTPAALPGPPVAPVREGVATAPQRADDARMTPRPAVLRGKVPGPRRVATVVAVIALVVAGLAVGGIRQIPQVRSVLPQPPHPVATPPPASITSSLPATPTATAVPDPLPATPPLVPSAPAASTRAAASATPTAEPTRRPSFAKVPARPEKPTSPQAPAPTATHRVFGLEQ